MPKFSRTCLLMLAVACNLLVKFNGSFSGWVTRFGESFIFVPRVSILRVLDSKFLGSCFDGDKAMMCLSGVNDLWPGLPDKLIVFTRRYNVGKYHLLIELVRDFNFGSRISEPDRSCLSGS